MFPPVSRSRGLFLPSQFFMVVVLVRATRSPGKAHPYCRDRRRRVLVLINFHEALIPTYRLDSVIPYRQIADDVAALSEAEGIETVMASDNSLNVESITRYLNRQAVSRPMRVLAGNRRRACAARGRAERQAVPLHLAHGGKGRVHRHPPTPAGERRGWFAVTFRCGTSPTTIFGSDDTRNVRDQPDAIDVWIVR